MLFVAPSYGLPSIRPYLGRQYARQRRKAATDYVIFELGIQPYCPSPYGTSNGRMTLFGCGGCTISTSNTLTCGSGKLRRPIASSSSGCSRYDTKSGNLQNLSNNLPACWTVGLAGCGAELTRRMTSSGPVAPRRHGQQ